MHSRPVVLVWVIAVYRYVFNTFAFGYAVGYHFIETPTGTMVCSRTLD